MISTLLLAAITAIAPLPAAPATTAFSAATDARAAATGFAAGTTGGAGGVIVWAETLDQLRTYAAAGEPLVIRVRGSIDVDPFGDMVRVASDKTIVGDGAGAELVGGGLFLNGTHNVIIRNLTIRDSYIPGDFDGKSADNDNDGIRLDTADHVWIDHNRIERVGDGGIDIRKDSTDVTLSWNVISDINKALGVGWTSNVLTRLTAHHNWIRNTVQRNWSIDNTAAAHLYNNYLENVTQYGTMSRNNAHVQVESSVFDQVNDPLVVYGSTATLIQVNNRFRGTTGRHDSAGEPFDIPYEYQPDPVDEVKNLVTRHAGPQKATARGSRTITVALDGTGDYGSLLAALGATRDVRGPVTIRVAPGYYREQVRVWPSQSDVTITGPPDAVVAYDLSSSADKFYGGPLGADAATFTLLGAGTTIRGLTITGTGAPAVRSIGDRTTLAGTTLTGLLAGAGRTYLRDCTLRGGGDLITGPGAGVLDRCTLLPDTGATIAAPDTAPLRPYGILIVRSSVLGPADQGSVRLGRSGQVVVRDSELGPQIAADPWSGPRERFGEWANTGPGAIGADRPLLTAAQARAFTVDTYLGGWRPRV
ncbi:pectinesterase family protein [Actinoplanes couchii]|uniref:Pectate lyase domain-containing protein n=1 Tax=Actinoplanes couchii TaxID=403638 RepID=A0ABQ3XP98_9ACTN|nr:pectinesterase family protein [Actinoplanes couchii]MDR6315900.1 pectate lyase [Actinoplanes couchii]GID60303.1 hypothetical protein Aco03nite_087070 [Actinoplanes couchii]